MYIKKFYSLLLIFFICIMSLFFSIQAKANVINNIYADSYVLVESKTLRVLDEKNMNKKLLPASITKILTCIAAIENGELNNYYTVTKEVVEQTGSSIYFEVGEKVKLIDLLYAMMLRSGNDAAYMTAISVSNSLDDFLNLMNNTAKKIGMNNSLFNNPSGLDETTENYSTAYDMAKLMAYALKNEIFAEITGTIKYTFETINGKKRTIENKHKLVKGYDFITGGKTGYTKKAHRTLVTSAFKNNMELICVTFNCGDDWNVHMNLFEYGFNQYKMKKLISEGIIDINDVFYEYTPYIPFPLSYPLKENEDYNLVVYLLNKSNSKIIGKIVLYKNSKEMYSQDVYRYY